jgi:hypothetical protein
LSPVEIEALLPAWTRYRALIDRFLEATRPAEPLP